MCLKIVMKIDVILCVNEISMFLIKIESGSTTEYVRRYIVRKKMNLFRMGKKLSKSPPTSRVLSFQNFLVLRI